MSRLLTTPCALAFALAALGAAPASAGTVVMETHVTADPARAWAMVTDVYHHERLTPGALKGVTRDGDDRLMAMANGAVVRQHIVTIDPEARRVVFAAVGTSLTHHSSAMQVFAEGSGARVVWTTDFLPNEMEGNVRRVMTEASASMKQVLDAKP